MTKQFHFVVYGYRDEDGNPQWEIEGDDDGWFQDGSIFDDEAEFWDAWEGVDLTTEDEANAFYSDLALLLGRGEGVQETN